MKVTITDRSKGNRQWRKPSGACKNYDVNLRTFRGWMKHHGLPYSRLPSGRILVCLEDVDQWLRQRKVTNKQADEILRDF